MMLDGLHYIISYKRIPNTGYHVRYTTYWSRSIIYTQTVLEQSNHYLTRSHCVIEILPHTLQITLHYKYLTISHDILKTRSMPIMI